MLKFLGLVKGVLKFVGVFLLFFLRVPFVLVEAWRHHWSVWGAAQLPAIEGQKIERAGALSIVPLSMFRPACLVFLFDPENGFKRFGEVEEIKVFGNLSIRVQINAITVQGPDNGSLYALQEGSALHVSETIGRISYHGYKHGRGVKSSPAKSPTRAEDNEGMINLNGRYIVPPLFPENAFKLNTKTQLEKDLDVIFDSEKEGQNKS